MFESAFTSSLHGYKNNSPESNRPVRETTPAATNVAGGANGASESPMASDTGLVEPAPLRQATTKISPLLKHLRDWRQPSHPHSLLHLEAISSTTQPIQGNVFVVLRKSYHVVVVEDGGASTSLSSGKSDIASKYAIVTKLQTRVSKHRL